MQEIATGANSLAILATLVAFALRARLRTTCGRFYPVIARSPQDDEAISAMRKPTLLYIFYKGFI